MTMKRYLTATVAALPLLAGCTTTSASVPTPVVAENDAAHQEQGAVTGVQPMQEERWSWNCPRDQKSFIIPDMEGLATLREAAHFFPGRERAQIRRTGHGEATALVRRVEDTGMSRLLLYKLDGKWFVDQMTACQPNR